MTVPVKLEDGHGSNVQARLSAHGEILTRDFDYSQGHSVTMDAANTAFNIWEPLSNHFFIVTGAIISANKSISTTDGTLVTLYSSDTIDGTTPPVNGGVFVQMTKSSSLTLLPLSIKINKGRFVNAKHDDTSINAEVTVTILGYYIPVDGEDLTSHG